jgi:ATP-dependent Clp protease ATP-binding subunit ClpB
LHLTDRAIDWLGEEGFDAQYGARPLKRVIQKEVVNVLSKMILASEIEKGKTVWIDEREGALTFSVKTS